MRLYEELYEIEEKRDHLSREQAAREDPQQERERLLAQVKQDNQEIASMERQNNELREKILVLQGDIRQVTTLDDPQ